MGGKGKMNYYPRECLEFMDAVIEWVLKASIKGFLEIFEGTQKTW